jgi:hypothetical protein
VSLHSPCACQRSAKRLQPCGRIALTPQAESDVASLAVSPARPSSMLLIKIAQLCDGVKLARMTGAASQGR